MSVCYIQIWNCSYISAAICTCSTWLSFGQSSCPSINCSLTIWHLSYITARSGLNPSSVLTGTIAPSPFTIALSIDVPGTIALSVDVPGTIALSIDVPGTIEFSMYLVQSHPLCTIAPCTCLPSRRAPRPKVSPTTRHLWQIDQLVNFCRQMVTSLAKASSVCYFKTAKYPITHSNLNESQAGWRETIKISKLIRKSPKSRSDSSVGSSCQILSNVVTPVTAVGAATRISNWVSSRLNSRMRKQNIRLRSNRETQEEERDEKAKYQAEIEPGNSGGRKRWESKISGWEERAMPPSTCSVFLSTELERRSDGEFLFLFGADGWEAERPEIDEIDKRRLSFSSVHLHVPNIARIQVLCQNC